MEGTPFILLIGLRGSGKSTIGRRLSEMTGRAFVDLDDLALARSGWSSIAEIWRREGERAFRALEVAALRETLARGDGAVVALGGGTPTAVGAEGLLRDARERGAAVIVYLRAAPSTLRARLAREGGADERRPSLTGGDPLEEIERVHGERDGLYRSLADHVLEVGAMDASGAAEAVRRACGVGGA